MQVHEFRSVPELSYLPIVSRDSPLVVDLLSSGHCSDVAEASDMHRLFELLIRSQYQPLLAVKRGSNDGGEVSIFFVRLDAPCWTALRKLNVLTDCQTLNASKPLSNRAIKEGHLVVGNEDS